MGSDFVDDHKNDEENDQERAEEDPGREDDVVSADGDTRRSVHCSEHGDHIMGHADVFAEANGAEKGDEVAGDCGVIGRGHVAEEIDDIVAGLSVKSHVAEENNKVTFDLAIDVDVAEKTDRVFYGRVGRDLNVVEELNRIVLGASGPGSEGKGGAEEAQGEKFTMHIFLWALCSSGFNEANRKLPQAIRSSLQANIRPGEGESSRVKLDG
jgi:hypothetical protein